MTLAAVLGYVHRASPRLDAGNTRPGQKRDKGQNRDTRDPEAIVTVAFHRVLGLFQTVCVVSSIGFPDAATMQRVPLLLRLLLRTLRDCRPKNFAKPVDTFPRSVTVGLSSVDPSPIQVTSVRNGTTLHAYHRPVDRGSVRAAVCQRHGDPSV